MKTRTDGIHLKGGGEEKARRSKANDTPYPSDFSHESHTCPVAAKRKVKIVNKTKQTLRQSSFFSTHSLGPILDVRKFNVSVPFSNLFFNLPLTFSILLQPFSSFAGIETPNGIIKL